jgi:hypothetical protein
MSLTSYRAAPPRAAPPPRVEKRFQQTWQRPTLPRLKTKYHRRWGVSRPSSEWDRVQPPRHNHQVGEAQTLCEKLATLPCLALRPPAVGSPMDWFGPNPARSRGEEERTCNHMSNENDQADRAISTGKLHTLLRFHTQPINVVVFHDSQGILVSRLVSRLDAFSGYPFRI